PHGKNHPSRLVAEMFRRIAHQVKLGATARSNIRSMNERIEAQTNSIMSECRDLIVTDLKRPLHKRSKAVLSHYEQSLQKIHELHTEIAKFIDIFATQPSPARPMLVKRNQNHAKTMVEH